MLLQQTELAHKVDKSGVTICSRCVYDSAVPGIFFDAHGVCNYCQLHDQMEQEYPTGEEGQRRLRAMADEIRAAGRRKKYDCVVGVSGGCDSSYLVVNLVELGLRPLAVHFDNTWNSPIATRNIYNVLEKLGVDLYTLVVNNEEYDDIYRSFFKAGVKDLDTPTDIALAATLYRAAERQGVNYIIEGHSFRTEGIGPLGWFYIDGKYVDTVHQQFGTKKMRTFPNMRLYDFLKWTAFKQIKRVRPLYYVNYHKADAQKLMSEKYGWSWYGGHHLENRFTAFLHSYFLPRRFNMDTRLLGHAALCRSSQLTREQALAELGKPQPYDPELVEMLKKRLGFSEEEFEQLMQLPRKTFQDYRTYKQTFERLRPLFWVLYKTGRVPKSFYIKFCRPWGEDIARQG
ncbi:MAG: N-acetyl sugar amidotransferase [Nevskiales bacterium]